MKQNAYSVNMSLENLYKELILDHSKNPHHYGRFANATHSAEGYNPVCGDHYWVDLQVQDQTITSIGFEGTGCAISKASASMMTDLVTEQTTDEAKRLIECFQSYLAGATTAPLSESLEAFSGIHEFPTRIKCASLAWHTLKAALEGKQKAKTE